MTRRMSCNTEWRIEVGDCGELGDVLVLFTGGGFDRFFICGKVESD